MTNRGNVISVAKFIVYPTYDYLNPPDARNGVYVPDVAILCLASNLTGPKVIITDATVGEVVTGAGFGYHGSASTGVSFDKNSRAWNVPVDSDLSSAFSPEYYTATKFSPYIPMNGQAYSHDSGGPVTKFGDQNSLVGINTYGNPLVQESGFTVYTKLSNPEIKSWIEQNTSLTPRLAIATDKTITLTGNTNLLYGLEATADFAAWQEIAVLTNLTGTVSFQDTNPAAHPFRAYRAVVK